MNGRARRIISQANPIGNRLVLDIAEQRDSAAATEERKEHFLLSIFARLTRLAQIAHMSPLGIRIEFSYEFIDGIRIMKDPQDEMVRGTRSNEARNVGLKAIMLANRPECSNRPIGKAPLIR